MRKKGEYLGDNLNNSSIVLYGSNFSSTVGSPRFNAIRRALIEIPISKISIFIGIIISDAVISKGVENGRLQFKQKYTKIEYFYYVFFQLSHYCSKGPCIIKTIIHKKVHYSLCFTTRSLPCITELYNLFYDATQSKKIIPNNIFFLLT